MLFNIGAQRYEIIAREKSRKNAQDRTETNKMTRHSDTDEIIGLRAKSPFWYTCKLFTNVQKCLELHTFKHVNKNQC